MLCSRCCFSVAKSCLNLCDIMDCKMSGFPVPHHLSGFVQVHVHWIGDAIQVSHLLSPSSPSAFNLSQHQSLFQWVCCSHQVAKVLKLQLQHQSFQKSIQSWFTLRLTALISLLSKGLSRIIPYIYWVFTMCQYWFKYFTATNSCRSHLFAKPPYDSTSHPYAKVYIEILRRDRLFGQFLETDTFPYVL